MTNRGTDIRGSVLDNLMDGVMVVEPGGSIGMFNPAAGRILDLSPDEVAGRTFGELFIAREGFDEFTELIMDSVGNESGGSRQVVALHVGGETRSLSVATSYLRSTRDDDAEPVALIAVFSDITEVRELRETELRMAKAVEAQHAELQTAYRQIEERNQTLAATLKKVQVARVLATVLVIGVFLGVGVYTWQPLDLFGSSSASAIVPSADASVGESLRTMAVEPQPVRTTISLVGKLAPWRKVSVTSPVESRIGEVHFQYGQTVVKDTLLVELDTAETNRQHREARVAYIDALKKFEAIEDWENGPEMADARRSFTRAKLEFESQENRLKRIAFLLKQGLVASSEHEDALRQYRGQQLDLEAARQDLEAARARGGQEARDKVELELDIAREKMRELEQSLQRSAIHAPLTGVVLAPATVGNSSLTEGKSIEKGAVLLTIGDFSRFSAVTKVDEVDVVRIEAGQAVSVTGNAFPGVTLGGIVTHASSQAEARARGAPEFSVVVTLDPLEAAVQGLLRAGMSSNLKIVVYRNDAALLVPIDAVERHGRKHRLQVVDRETGEPRAREVEIGPTTLDSVEIVAGLEPGDEIVVPVN